MTFTFYPKRLLLTAVGLVALGMMLDAAADVERGATTAGILAVAAYVIVELLMSVNPAAWWRERNGHH